MGRSLRKARRTGRSWETHGRENESYSSGARATAVVSTGGRNARALRYVAVLPKENANGDRPKDKDKEEKDKKREKDKDKEKKDKKKGERQSILKYSDSNDAKANLKRRKAHT